MNEDATQPEGEKPRYLLPEGCKDLIDTLLPERQFKRLMYVCDADGNSLGPPQEVAEPELIPSGLSALPSYVARLFRASNPIASLSVFAADDQRGLGLARQGDQTLLSFFCPSQGSTQLEASVRALLASYEITSTDDNLSTDDTMRHIDYLLPQSLAGVTTVCRELLINCFRLQPDEPLHFVLGSDASLV